MLICFVACGESDNKSESQTNAKKEEPKRAATYEETVQIYLDAVFNPKYNSKNIKYLAPEDFWSNNLGNVSLDAVINTHKKNKSTYIEDWYDDIEPGRYYLLKTTQNIKVITPDSNLNSYYDYTTRVEQVKNEYKVKVDKDSTIYFVDERLIDLYEDGETKNIWAHRKWN